MRTQQETDKATKRVHLGQAGSFLIQGELGPSRPPTGPAGRPTLVLVGKRFRATDPAGGPLTLVYTSRR